MYFSDENQISTVESAALIAFGHLCGALSYCSEATLRIFAGKALRHTLIAALRQEGHAFTDMRFHAWFAGLTTLSDDNLRGARAPRALCNAILTELANWGDTAMARAAGQLKTALLAPLEGQEEHGNAEANRIIEAARVLTHSLPAPRNSDPLADLETVHEAITASIEFAPSELITTRLATDHRLFEVELPSPRPPIWAIDMLFARRLFTQRRLPIMLPLPGLTRRDAGDRRQAYAGNLQTAVHQMTELLADAATLAPFAHAPIPGRRASSRAPLLMELLAGFGPLRSRQIETMLGASRLGIAGMVDSWDAVGAIGRTTISGSHLLEMRATRSPPVSSIMPEASAFSTSAIADYDASLEEIDRLLARNSDAEQGHLKTRQGH